MHLACSPKCLCEYLLEMNSFQQCKLVAANCVWSSQSRNLATGNVFFAGFQGVKGAGSASLAHQNRLERKKRLIRKLEKQSLEMKPVKDFNIRYSWKLPERRRPVPELNAAEIEERILLQKEWSRSVTQRTREEDRRLDQLKQSQERALYELKQESEKLYLAALEVDSNIFPLTIEGPSETPPLLNYLSPLGGTILKEEDE